MAFVTKDSGERKDFETGAVRDVRAGKGRYDLISPLALKRLAQVYERGAAKYDPRNWEKGMPIGRCMDSAIRHIMQYMEGMRDEDHLAQAAWNLFSAMHYEVMIERGLMHEALGDTQDYIARVPI